MTNKEMILQMLEHMKKKSEVKEIYIEEIPENRRTEENPAAYCITSVTRYDNELHCDDFYFDKDENFLKLKID